MGAGARRLLRRQGCSRGGALRRGLPAEEGSPACRLAPHGGTGGRDAPIKLRSVVGVPRGASHLAVEFMRGSALALRTFGIAERDYYLHFGGTFGVKELDELAHEFVESFLHGRAQLRQASEEAGW